MRKTLALILSALMVLSILCMGITVSAAPEGTAIKTAADFIAMDPAGNYYLDADLVLSGTYAQKFTGTFDGNGHTVTVAAPMFKYFDGKIMNLTVNGEINANDGLATAAVAIRTVDGMYAENVTTNVNITLTGDKRGMYAAGILATDNFVAADNTEYYNDTWDANNDSASSVFIKCKNTGNITVNATIPEGNSATTASTMKPRAGGICAVCEGIFAIECENTGNIIIPLTECTKDGDAWVSGKNVTSAISGGIVARSGLVKSTNETYCLSCKNSGEITAYGNAAGIASYIGCADNVAHYQIHGCVNTGKIIAPNQAGGIVSYAYTGGSADIHLAFCLNTGDIYYGDADALASASNFGSPFFAYSNCKSNEITCCIDTGVTREIAEDGFTAFAHCVIGCSSANPIDYNAYFNTIYDPEGHFVNWSYNTDANDEKNPGKRHTIQEAIDLDMVTIITSLDDVRSGKTAFEANTKYYEDNVDFEDDDWDGTYTDTIRWFANRLSKAASDTAKYSGEYTYSYVWHQKIGVDEVPTVENIENTFIDFDGSKYINVAALPIAGEEETTAEETNAETQAQETQAETKAPETQAQETQAQETQAETKAAEPEKKGCGSVVGIGVAIVAILGTAFVAKKRF